MGSIVREKTAGPSRAVAPAVYYLGGESGKETIVNGSQNKFVGPESRPGSRSGVLIRDFVSGEDATAFRRLNEEWISLYFTLEDRDREQLGRPQTILDQGGRIYMAEYSGEGVGCVALVPMPNQMYELSKMAVAPPMQGLGIGRALLLHAIAQGKALGARALFLGSNTKLSPAVRLYESVGFLHVDPETLPKLAYSRANIFMELALVT